MASLTCCAVAMARYVVSPGGRRESQACQGNSKHGDVVDDHDLCDHTSQIALAVTPNSLASIEA